MEIWGSTSSVVVVFNSYFFVICIFSYEYFYYLCFLRYIYMVGYYKVHKNNFDSFITFLMRKYKNFQNYDLKDFKSYYFNNADYLYLSVQYHYSYDKYIVTYMVYSEESVEWYRTNSISYCGEYHGRKEKLDRLNNIFSV